MDNGMVKKTSRTLGWVGVATTIYAYVGCLNQATNTGIFEGQHNL